MQPQQHEEPPPSPAAMSEGLPAGGAPFPLGFPGLNSIS